MRGFLRFILRPYIPILEKIDQHCPSWAQMKKHIPVWEELKKLKKRIPSWEKIKLDFRSKETWAFSMKIVTILLTIFTLYLLGLAFRYSEATSNFLAVLSVNLGFFAIYMSLNSSIMMEARTYIEIRSIIGRLPKYAKDIPTDLDPNIPAIYMDIETCSLLWKWINKADRGIIQITIALFIHNLDARQKTTLYLSNLDKLRNMVKNLKHLNI